MPRRAISPGTTVATYAYNAQGRRKVLCFVEVQKVMREQVFLAAIHQSVVAADRFELRVQIGREIKDGVELAQDDGEVVAIEKMKRLVFVDLHEEWPRRIDAGLAIGHRETAVHIGVGKRLACFGRAMRDDNPVDDHLVAIDGDGK